MRSIALVDVNNFYASCERVYNPKLEGKPVVVLSNNDGCAIARNAQAKALGIKMGEPAFKLKDIVKQHGVILLSSNYALYADMSNRVMSILSTYTPLQEVYSIDESFIDLTGMPGSHSVIATDIRNKIKKWTGLPVCVGIGATKTLAKIANHIAKKRDGFNGVCDLNQLSSKDTDTIFSEIEVGEVWGVGRRLAERLQAIGICSVYDLKCADPEFIRQQFSVVLEKTVRELNGTLCIELEEVSPPKQQIISSRSFGRPVFDLASLSESVSMYMSKASEKLRKQHSYATTVSVYIRTSPFAENKPRYSASYTVALPAPTNDTIQLVNVALWILKKLYKPGYEYQKSGVMLGDIVSAEGSQSDLFGFTTTNHTPKLMTVLDSINQKWGRGTLRVGSQGFNSPWAMKQGNKTPSYTTKWSELVRVR
jgi:DNA polymerase V